MPKHLHNHVTSQQRRKSAVFWGSPRDFTPKPHLKREEWLSHLVPCLLLKEEKLQWFVVKGWIAEWLEIWNKDFHFPWRFKGTYVVVPHRGIHISYLIIYLPACSMRADKNRHAFLLCVSSHSLHFWPTIKVFYYIHHCQSITSMLFLPIYF